MPAPVGTASARPPRPRPASYSACIAAAVAGPPQRGLVHSVFHAAANIVFPGNFVLSLNTTTSPRMPNGIQLPTPPGTMPVSHLRVGMPILVGAQRLCIQPLNYILDLSNVTQWNPYIERPAALDMNVVQKNIAWLRERIATNSQYCSQAANTPSMQEDDGRMANTPSMQEDDGRTANTPSMQEDDGRPQGATPRLHPTPVPTIYDHAHDRCIVGTGVGWRRGVAPCGRPSIENDSFDLNGIDLWLRPSIENDSFDLNGIDLWLRPSTDVLDMARSLCGRGVGLTPSGDDMLAGWMATGWLLHGPQPDFLAACQHIVAIARQQTHLLSQCWLECAANGYVAEPVGTLLHALTQTDEQQLAHSTQTVVAMGATSGYDLIQGILMATGGL